MPTEAAIVSLCVSTSGLTQICLLEIQIPGRGSRVSGSRASAAVARLTSGQLTAWRKWDRDTGPSCGRREE